MFLLLFAVVFVSFPMLCTSIYMLDVSARFLQLSGLSGSVLALQLGKSGSFGSF